eukprot:408477_1
MSQSHQLHTQSNPSNTSFTSNTSNISNTSLTSNTSKNNNTNNNSNILDDNSQFHITIIKPSNIVSRIGTTLFPVDSPFILLKSPLNPPTPISPTFPLTSSTQNISNPSIPTPNNHTQNTQLTHFYDPFIYKNSDDNINNNNNTYNNNNYTDLDDGISLDAHELLDRMDNGSLHPTLIAQSSSSLQLLINLLNKLSESLPIAQQSLLTPNINIKLNKRTLYALNPRP